jgi:hypothetical protein
MSFLKDYGKLREKTLYNVFVIKTASFLITIELFTFC